MESGYQGGMHLHRQKQVLRTYLQRFQRTNRIEVGLQTQVKFRRHNLA